jgi:hypothetical protein
LVSVAITTSLLVYATVEAFSTVYQHVTETLAGHRFCLRQYGIRANPLPNLAAEKPKLSAAAAAQTTTPENHNEPPPPLIGSDLPPPPLTPTKLKHIKNPAAAADRLDLPPPQHQKHTPKHPDPSTS